MSGDWLTWQIVDSAFPTGAFAHSGGLESAWQHGEVRDAHDLGRFLDASIHQAGFAILPLVNATYREPDRLEEFDACADAFLLNTVANRASRIQGRTLAATIHRVWPLETTRDLLARIDRTCAHVAPIAGAAFQAVGLPLPVVQRTMLFGACRALVSAAVRLGIVGSYEAQRLEETAAACRSLSAGDLAQTAPLVDLLQAGHDRLYSRLFQS
jgi:urease accessory protein